MIGDARTEKIAGAKCRTLLPPHRRLGYISPMARDPKNFTGENVRGMLEASYRDERMREGNKLVAHFGLALIAVVAVVGALVVALVQLLR